MILLRAYKSPYADRHIVKPEGELLILPVYYSSELGKRTMAKPWKTLR